MKHVFHILIFFALAPAHADFLSTPQKVGYVSKTKFCRELFVSIPEAKTFKTLSEAISSGRPFVAYAHHPSANFGDKIGVVRSFSFSYNIFRDAGPKIKTGDHHINWSEFSEGRET